MAIKILQTASSEKIDANTIVSPVGFEAKLPWLSKVMKISSNPKDYFMFPVPIMYSDLPNRNGIGFPLEELVKWNPEAKCQAYETWRYAPMFEEHQSDDIETAIGVIADVALTPMTEFGNGKIWKVVCLVAIDRTKNKELASEVEQGKINSYSMGAMVDSWYCSYCGAEQGKCHHIQTGTDKVTFYELNGKLVYKMVKNICGYETSVVRDPAFLTAISDHKITYR